VKYGSQQRIHPGVIESADSRVRRPRRRRFDFSPRQALHYNDHPNAIIEDFDRSEYGAVLREVERHVIDWERLQTPGQAEWVAMARRRTYRSVGEAAKEIVEALRR
jgi:hypothetical protein